LYTDSIIFAPLTSNFLTATNKVAAGPSFISAPVTPAAQLGGSQPSYFSSASQGMASGSVNPPNPSLLSRPKSALGTGNQSLLNDDGIPRTRKEWVSDWQQANPGRPGPVSAKAIYRLADSKIWVLSFNAYTNSFK
jgi:hypothetical protein